MLHSEYVVLFYLMLSVHVSTTLYYEKDCSIQILISLSWCSLTITGEVMMGYKTVRCYCSFHWAALKVKSYVTFLFYLQHNKIMGFFNYDLSYHSCMRRKMIRRNFVPLTLQRFFISFLRKPSARSIKKDIFSKTNHIIITS